VDGGAIAQALDQVQVPARRAVGITIVDGGVNPGGGGRVGRAAARSPRIGTSTSRRASAASTRRAGGRTEVTGRIAVVAWTAARGSTSIATVRVVTPSKRSVGYTPSAPIGRRKPSAVAPAAGTMLKV